MYYVYSALSIRCIIYRIKFFILVPFIDLLLVTFSTWAKTRHYFFTSKADFLFVKSFLQFRKKNQPVPILSTHMCHLMSVHFGPFYLFIFWANPLDYDVGVCGVFYFSSISSLCHCWPAHIVRGKISLMRSLYSGRPKHVCLIRRWTAGENFPPQQR